LDGGYHANSWKIDKFPGIFQVFHIIIHISTIRYLEIHRILSFIHSVAFSDRGSCPLPENTVEQKLLPRRV
jgi:hypothetical protein